MTDTEDMLGSRTVRDRVRETLQRAPVFEVAEDLPNSWLDLLDELDRVLRERDAGTSVI